MRNTYARAAISLLQKRPGEVTSIVISYIGLLLGGFELVFHNEPLKMFEILGTSLGAGAISRYMDRLTDRKLPLVDFPKLWSYFAFILTHKVRKEVFDPSFNELHEDYLHAKAAMLDDGCLATAWLNVAFSFRTIYMVGGCVKAAVGDRAFKAVLKLIPTAVRKYFLLP